MYKGEALALIALLVPSLMAYGATVYLRALGETMTAAEHVCGVHVPRELTVQAVLMLPFVGLWFVVATIANRSEGPLMWGVARAVEAMAHGSSADAFRRLSVDDISKYMGAVVFLTHGDKRPARVQVGSAVEPLPRPLEMGGDMPVAAAPTPSVEELVPDCGDPLCPVHGGGSQDLVAEDFALGFAETAAQYDDFQEAALAIADLREDTPEAELRAAVAGLREKASCAVRAQLVLSRAVWDPPAPTPAAE